LWIENDGHAITIQVEDKEGEIELNVIIEPISSKYDPIQVIRDYHTDENEKEQEKKEEPEKETQGKQVNMLADHAKCTKCVK